MFDTVRNNRRIVQGFLALITLPFAMWGVESYISNDSSGAEIAVVGDTKIKEHEFQQSLREQGERMQQQLRENFDPKMLDTPEARRTVLASMVNQRLLTLAAKDAHLAVSDEALAQFIAQVPVLQDNGKFSPERYEALVSARGMSKEGFEARLRQDMAMQQLVQPVGEAVVVAKQSAARWASVQLEQRTVAEYRVAPEAFIKQVKIDADAAQKFYEANQSKFQLPEQVKVEYVVLDQEALAQQVSVSEADIEARYKAHPERYTQAETRRASHILLVVAKDASDADIAKVETKAKEILSQVKANPKTFVELAKKHSQDPGSAQKGGDLEWFGKGMMVKPFEDAVFSLKQDQISEVVRSDFGLHIIRVTGIKAERVVPLGEVRSDIAAEVKREASTRKFAEAVDAFNNTVYEQPDTLQPAAAQWKLVTQKSDWLRKGDRLPAPFDNPKLQAAIFAADATSKKQNTEAVELAPGKMAAARVIEHKAATMQAFDLVKAVVLQQMTQEKANELAIAEGEAKLAALLKGDSDEVKWGASRKILRAAPQGLPRDAATAIFTANSAALPVFVGAKAEGGGYTLYKLTDVIAAEKNDPRLAMLSQQYARLIAEEDFGSWMSGLRNRYPVKIREDQVVKKPTE